MVYSLKMVNFRTWDHTLTVTIDVIYDYLLLYVYTTKFSGTITLKVPEIFYHINHIGMIHIFSSIL